MSEIGPVVGTGTAGVGVTYIKILKIFPINRVQASKNFTDLFN
jgi:hypothetical protein